LKNLGRRPARTAAILTGLAAVSAVVFVLSAVYSSGTESIKKGLERLGADAMLVSAEVADRTGDVLLSGAPAPFYMDASVAETVRGAEGVEAAASQLFIVSANLACCSVSDTVLIGFEPERDFTVTPWLRERLDRGLDADEIIIGSNVLQEPGGKAQFYGKLFVVAGKLDRTGVGFIDSSVFIPMESAREMIDESGERAETALDIRPDEISAVMIRFEDGVPQEKAALMLEYMLPGHGVVLAADAMRTARREMAAPLKAALAAGLLQWAASLVMIGALYGLSISERKRELGLMRAMGAKRRDLLRLFLSETFVISLAGGLLGIVCGTLFVTGLKEMLSSFFGLPFETPSAFRLLAFASVTMLFSLATAFGATVYPILRSARRFPSEAISGGG
jgi:putative ABC transport system permease protein